jgi:hypothetical protein
MAAASLVSAVRVLANGEPVTANSTTNAAMNTAASESLAAPAEAFTPHIVMDSDGTVTRC